MKNSCFQTSGGHYSEFVAIQFRCCYVLCNFGRRLLKSNSMESLAFRKVKIFSCWEAEHTPYAPYTGWERLEVGGGGKQGKRQENRSLEEALERCACQFSRWEQVIYYKKRCACVSALGCLWAGNNNSYSSRSVSFPWLAAELGENNLKHMVTLPGEAGGGDTPLLCSGAGEPLLRQFDLKRGGDPVIQKQEYNRPLLGLFGAS